MHSLELKNTKSEGLEKGQEDRECTITFKIQCSKEESDFLIENIIEALNLLSKKSNLKNIELTKRYDKFISTLTN
jgi:hypothetical protein